LITHSRKKTLVKQSAKKVCCFQQKFASPNDMKLHASATSKFVY
jgi:hypothetical protein